MSDQLALARLVKDRLRKRLAGDPRVRGVGLARRADGFAIRVLVTDLGAAAQLGLPAEVDGFAVEVNPVGEVHAQD